jgi:hypothetical protein
LLDLGKSGINVFDLLGVSYFWATSNQGVMRHQKTAYKLRHGYS